MKKLTFLFLLMFFGLGLFAQTGTIKDYGTYIDFNYASGDTVSVGKLNVTHILIRREEVFIFTNHAPDGSTNVKNHWIVITPSDFGYSSAVSLRMYLSAICFNAYREVYVYDGGNLDSVKYYYGSQLQYSIDYGYTGTVVTSKTIVTQ